MALSQKEGGTLSLTGLVCSPCSVLGEGWLFFSSFCFSFFFFLFFLFFFDVVVLFFLFFFSFSTDKLRSRTGAVVFSPSVRPPVVNWLWAPDSSVNYIPLPSVSGWQYCWPCSCPVLGWRWYTWQSRWPWHWGMERETSCQTWPPNHSRNHHQSPNTGFSTPVGCTPGVSRELPLPFI